MNLFEALTIHWPERSAACERIANYDLATACRFELMDDLSAASGALAKAQFACALALALCVVTLLAIQLMRYRRLTTNYRARQARRQRARALGERFRIGHWGSRAATAREAAQVEATPPG